MAAAKETKSDTIYAQLIQFTPYFNGNSNSIHGRWYVAEGFANGDKNADKLVKIIQTDRFG